MTTSNLNYEDILTCSVCLEIFKNPKYLPCLHTFCECCLQSYISSGFEKGNKENIECPVCRAPISVPNTTCTPEEWVKVMPVNLLVSGLIENQKASRPEKLCMLCERFASKTVEKAMFFCLQCSDTLCGTCEKYHSHMKWTSVHEVKPLEEFLDETPMKRYKNKCLYHPDKVIEFYCVNHETPFCSICVAVEHKTCSIVQTIEEASKGIASSNMFKTVQDEMQAVMAGVDTVISSYKNNLSKLEKQYENQLNEINITFETLKNNLDIQENSRKAELLKVFNEKKNTLETILTDYENKRKTAENGQRILDISVSKSSEDQLMIELAKIRDQVNRLKKEIVKCAHNVNEFDLVLQNTDINDVIKQLDNTCIVRCETQSIWLPDVYYKFNRFTSLGGNNSNWSVQSKVDAISFSVSEKIWLHGFLTFGPRHSEDACTVKAEVKISDERLASVESQLDTNTDQSKLTKFKLTTPISIMPNVQYDVLFIMTSKGLCNYGKNGQSELKCEGVVFKFTKSTQSNNGTKIESGQIPGFLFTKD